MAPPHDGVGSGAAPRRVLVVDDHRAMADALRLTIDLEPDLECAGVAETVGEAIAVCAATGVDVVVMDVDLPDVDGIEGTKRIRAAHPTIEVFIFTGFGDLATLAAAAAAGASGFFAKNLPLRDVLAALTRPAAGHMVVDPEALRRLLVEAEAPRPAPPLEPPALTEREQQVFGLLCAGLGPQAIAGRLGITVNTARGHVKSILAKLEVHSQLEAVVLAGRHGWMTDAPTC